MLDTKSFTWTKAQTKGPKPSPRNSHTATIVKIEMGIEGTPFAAGDTLMVIVGGSCPMRGPKGDVYALKLNAGKDCALQWAKLKVSTWKFCEEEATDLLHSALQDCWHSQALVRAGR